VAETSQSPGHLRQIVLVNLTLTLADVMSVFFRELFPVNTITPSTTDALNTYVVDSHDSILPATETSNIADITPPDNVPPAITTKAPDEWYAVECLLKHKRQKGRDFFLVKWQNTDDVPSWKPRENVTPFAIQQFYRTRRAQRASK